MSDTDALTIRGENAQILSIPYEPASSLLVNATSYRVDGWYVHTFEWRPPKPRPDERPRWTRDLEGKHRWDIAARRRLRRAKRGWR